MSISDFFGFIVICFALALLVLENIRKERHRQRRIKASKADTSPTNEQATLEKEDLNALIRALTLDLEEPKEAPRIRREGKLSHVPQRPLKHLRTHHPLPPSPSVAHAPLSSSPKKHSHPADAILGLHIDQSERNYMLIDKEPPSKGKTLIAQLKSPKEMIILNAIIGPPKSLQ